MDKYFFVIKKSVNLLPLFLMLFACTQNKNTGRKEEKIYQVGQIKTEMGEILFWLYEETPRHKASFIKLANAGYWDSLTFNRVIKNFVAQGGCPDTPDGKILIPDTSFLLKPEFVSNIRHVYGAVGAGRDDNPGKLSFACQFYIVQNKDGIPRLNDKYTVFGQVFQGMDIVDRIVSVRTDSNDSPLIPIRMDINVINLSGKELKNYPGAERKIH
jgi:peptidyl-prolyl cis-trans isomerase B (cyclophilin B)